ncbi:MAG: AcrB/AcrD/AcrF family protein, partial [Rhodobacteraceae bacterium]|nr:AcrB/AcrD/AcrF family protein [Paracoccaceae bacterium]
VEGESGTFSVKIPGSFDDVRDIYALPVKLNGDRVVTLGELATIRMTFEDRTGTARFNGETTVALQVVKRKGYNLIDTAEEVKRVVAQASENWPEELQVAVNVGTSNDQSRVVGSMVQQLEGSVLTAIALVMIVVLAALGPRPAILVGFAIPTSFLLCFVLLGLMDITISNIVMFGLILAVGMLVDGAIVVVEYADKRISEGVGPMSAYVEAAKRMFWPVVSSTATTLCAFLPMLFWPGVPGEFMGMLPVTLIFVLAASLVVALIYLPVMGGVTGRISRVFTRGSDLLRARLPWVMRALLVPVVLAGMFIGAMMTINPDYFGPSPLTGPVAALPGILVFLLSAFAASVVIGSAKVTLRRRRVQGGHRRTLFGRFIWLLTANPVMPLVTIGAVLFFVVSVFGYYGSNNKGVEFFTESEPEQAIVYVRARGNLSLTQKDALVREVEEIVLRHPGVMNAFAFAGDGGLSTNTGGAEPPLDTIGQIQLEIVPWEDRRDQPELDGDIVIAELTEATGAIPGIKTEILSANMGPASAKPVHLRLMGDNWEELKAATQMVRDRFDETRGLTLVEDTLPLPGIDWQIDVDVENAGRYGANVTTVGAMVQLITQGLELDTMPVETSDEEIPIRVRLPEEDRVLSTLDTLKVRTAQGLVPLSNFITRTPVEKLAQIKRVDQKRYFDVKAAVAPGLMTDGIDPRTGEPTQVPMTAQERVAHLTEWLDTSPLPASVSFEWTGDQEDQEESATFLMTAFSAALALMFIILLAQFNSFYNSVLVLLAVVLSTAGVLIGMLVMDQAFSIIMTGTGIVALAGIVVNNNIVLIDTYQEYSAYMPRIEAIIRTAEDRIRPVFLTTITTMAGLAPMMFGLSLDFWGGGYSIDSPTALWWKQLATAVVFGLGIATMLTLVFTPTMLALRVWVSTYVLWISRGLAKLSLGSSSRAARDWALSRSARRTRHAEILWPLEGEAAEAETTSEGAPEEEHAATSPAPALVQEEAEEQPKPRYPDPFAKPLNAAE